MGYLLRQHGVHVLHNLLRLITKTMHSRPFNPGIQPINAGYLKIKSKRRNYLDSLKAATDRTDWNKTFKLYLRLHIRKRDFAHSIKLRTMQDGRTITICARQVSLQVASSVAWLLVAWLNIFDRKIIRALRFQWNKSAFNVLSPQSSRLL